MCQVKSKKTGAAALMKLLSGLMALLPLTGAAQQMTIVKGNCTPGLVGCNAIETRALGAADMLSLPRPSVRWDASKTYKQLVVLVSYSDVDFLEEHDKRFYERILNEPGYNHGRGRGCVADYFREQSGGLFNLEFDVFGPYKVSYTARKEDMSPGDVNYAYLPMHEANRKMIADNPTWDFKQYDWNGDNWIDQVIYIFAGYGGNQGPESYGYVWPNTGSISGINSTHDGITISNYTNSAELWTDNTSCGIGTICHEYSHSLGLPDIYPTFGDTDFYSVCDEWDLMDGGNFTNMGWCPPNYTAQEKMYLGWLTPEELTEPVTITDMKPISEGGETYIIRHTDKEYLLLENRQWTGWDAGVPGRGLVVTHVDFDESIWRNNAVNTAKGHFRCDIVHADNLHYEEWANLIDSQQWPMYAEAVGMHNRHLSTSPYPWSTDSTTVVNDEVSDTSRPATVMFNVDAEGKKLLSKAVTNIRMTDDGLISFDFMGGTRTHIPSIDRQPRGGGSEVYNIMGQRIATPGKGLFIKNGKKYIKH